jgi:hypothetical protein
MSSDARIKKKKERKEKDEKAPKDGASIYVDGVEE